MTTIYNTDTGKTVELELRNDRGIDFLYEVIVAGGYDYTVEVPDDCDLAMSDEEIEWWERWSVREQRINDRLASMGVGEQAKVPNFYLDYPDNWPDAQTAYEEYLGIED